MAIRRFLDVQSTFSDTHYLSNYLSSKWGVAQSCKKIISWVNSPWLFLTLFIAGVICFSNIWRYVSTDKLSLMKKEHIWFYRRPAHSFYFVENWVWSSRKIPRIFIWPVSYILPMEITTQIECCFIRKTNMIQMLLLIDSQYSVRRLASSSNRFVKYFCFVWSNLALCKICKRVLWLNSYSRETVLLYLDGFTPNWPKTATICTIAYPIQICHSWTMSLI